MIRSLLLLSLLPILLLPAGCFSQSRTDATRTERVTFQAQVPIPTADGVKVLPITGTLRRTIVEQEETHSGPDLDAIAQAVAGSVSQGLAALGPAVAGAGLPWSGILGGVGTALTAATTGYLALKKREQMKVPHPTRTA